MAIKIGTRVVNQYTLSPKCGQHGKVINFASHVHRWSSVWAMIRYDDGSESSEMKIYLSREDKL